MKLNSKLIKYRRIKLKTIKKKWVNLSILQSKYEIRIKKILSLTNNKIEINKKINFFKKIVLFVKLIVFCEESNNNNNEFPSSFIYFFVKRNFFLKKKMLSCLQPLDFISSFQSIKVQNDPISINWVFIPFGTAAAPVVKASRN
jgi:hypothetical protein